LTKEATPNRQTVIGQTPKNGMFFIEKENNQNNIEKKEFTAHK